MDIYDDRHRDAMFYFCQDRGNEYIDFLEHYGLM